MELLSSERRLIGCKSVPEFLQELIRFHETMSRRALQRFWRWTNPSLLGDIFAGRRRLTHVMAQRVCSAEQFQETVQEVFLLLVDLQYAEEDAARLKLARCQVIRDHFKNFGPSKVMDASIFDSWLYAVLYELVGCERQAATIDRMCNRLLGLAPRPEIVRCLRVMTKKGWLSEVEGLFTRSEIYFETLDDKRRIALQRNHQFFLNMAQHRLADSLDAREFRGLTVALSREEWLGLKAKLRDVMKELRQSFGEKAQSGDHVFRIQICGFRITQK